jgi:hypothetical protein
VWEHGLVETAFAEGVENGIGHSIVISRFLVIREALQDGQQ